MTAAELLARLTALGCRVVVAPGGEVKVRGNIDRIAPELEEILHASREVLAVEILTAEALALAGWLDTPSVPYQERLRRVPEYCRLLDRLAAAQQQVYDAWRARGWEISWDADREVFYLSGSGPPPVGAERYVVRATAGGDG